MLDSTQLQKEIDSFRTKVRSFSSPEQAFQSFIGKKVEEEIAGWFHKTYNPTGKLSQRESMERCFADCKELKTLAIDIETYSSNDLLKCGVYKYAEAEDFTILLFAFKYGSCETMVVDLASGETIPDFVLRAITDPSWLKTAFNASFERTCIAKYLGIEMPPEQWECTMVRVANLGLPMSLDSASKALGLDTQKDSAGKALIRYFSIPCKPTKANEGRTRNFPEHAPDKWQQFKAYCLQDVRVELAIREATADYNIPRVEKRLWDLDQRINDLGVRIDAKLITQAIHMDQAAKDEFTKEAVDITQLDNPNSVAQLKNWLEGETGEAVSSLSKAAVTDLIDEQSANEAVRRTLELRQEMSKSSVKKYMAMYNAKCADRRVRGLFQFYGANRTGRWSGRLVQMQNLPRNSMNDLDVARDVVRSGDLQLTEMLFGSVSDTLSQLIRTAFVAPKGSRLIVADFSAIEARVIAWLAGESWRMEVFNTHGKIYEASASQMFKIPLEEVTKDSPYRQKGKVAELALGYQGGANALITMGALKGGLTEAELPSIVQAWRKASPAIVRLWYRVGDAAIEAVEMGVKTVLGVGMAKGQVTFQVKNKKLFITLPSGRALVYQEPMLVDGKFGNPELQYRGMDGTTHNWSRVKTYGGKLVENIVQAIARDCLAVAMLRTAKAGYQIIGHVHDEMIIETPNNEGSLQEVLDIMAKPIKWASELPLKAAGYETKFYKKD